MISRQLPFILLIMALVAPVPQVAWGVTTADEGAPVSTKGTTKIAPPLSRGAREEEQTPEPGNELVIRVGNESNQPDGVFGPLTYGLRGSHRFGNELAVEAGYIRLHEPGSPPFSSFLDEAQLTLKSPPLSVADHPMVLDATAWTNRMIDMYTNLGGVEASYGERISVHGGLYLGNATREGLSSAFLGFQVGLSLKHGPVELSLSHLQGRIQPEGAYRWTSAGVSTVVNTIHQLPVGLTFDVESRYFNFGPSGPTSSADDEWIGVLGLELHLEKALLGEGSA